MKQCKNVMIILYEEPLKEYIEFLHPYKWAYICHNHFSDFEKEQAKEKGSEEKIHWHLLLSFETKKSLSIIANVFGIQENLIECVNNYKSMERYLVHLDNEEKFQFNVDDVISNYDYKTQVYSTTESILKFLIDECKKTTSVSDFNIMIMNLGVDYMKVYKQYYSMIKDVIYFNNKKHQEGMRENCSNKLDYVDTLCYDELLYYYNEIINGVHYDEQFERKIIAKCQEKEICLCRGLKNEEE